MARLLRAPVLALFAAAFVQAQAASALVINNGLAPPNPTNVVDASDGLTSSDSVQVANAGCTYVSPDFSCAGPPGASTDVHITSGVSLNSVRVGVTSSATVDAFNVGSVAARDNSHVTMTGIQGDATVTDDATMVYNGTSFGGIFASGRGHLELNGSAFSSTSVGVSEDASIHVVGGVNSDSRITLSDNAYFEMSGGNQFRSFSMTGASRGLLRGGTIGGDIGAGAHIGSGAELDWTDGGFTTRTSVSVDGLLRIFGTDFIYDGVPVGFGELATVSYPTYIQGTSATGQTLLIALLSVGAGGSIVLVPEPATGSLVALGVAALGARRRRGGRS